MRCAGTAASITRAKLALKAPALGERAEVWQIDAAPMWHVDASGVPTSASDDGLRYQPLPGEMLHLAFSQPVAVAGDSLAFDGVQSSSAVGERATETTLVMQARSTRGGEHAITLPAGAELLGAQRDGETLNLAVRDGKLSLPLLPGAHQFTVAPARAARRRASVHTPALALHAPVANIDLDLHLPQDRWVLWTWGPTNGPAVLYWSQLVVLLLAAWLLARFAPTPLRFHHWLLLGLGFSAFAWSAYALVVLWLILLGLRARGALRPGGVDVQPDAGRAGRADAARAGRAGRRRAQRPARPARHARGGQRLQRLEPALVRRPERGRAAARRCLQRLAVGLQDRHAGVGAVAGQCPDRLAALGFRGWTRGGYWRNASALAAAVPPPMPPPSPEPPNDA